MGYNSKDWESVLDDIFTGAASGKTYKKAGASRPKQKPPAVQKEKPKESRRIEALKNVINDPGATEGEKSNARALLKKLEAKGGK